MILYLISPSAVRVRVANSIDLNYYSNSERLQMLKVGWQMMREHPLTGVGPGRVDKLYESYLSSGDPVPAYHGHLHNNLAQIVAQFGIPATVLLLLFVGVVFHNLVNVRKTATTRDARFRFADSSSGLHGISIRRSVRIHVRPFARIDASFLRRAPGSFTVLG